MKSLKPALVLALVFVAGVASGVVGARIVVRRVITQVVQHPEKLREHIARDLSHKLNLTPDQQAKLEPILADSQSRIRDLRLEFAPRFFSIVNQTGSNVSSLLTPEQQKRFEQYQEQHRYLFRPGER